MRGACRLASLLGGQLHVSDRNDGVRGTKFELCIPLKLPAALPSSVVAPLARLGSPQRSLADVVIKTRPAMPMRSNVRSSCGSLYVCEVQRFDA